MNPRPARAPRRSPDGFALVEVLLALSLLSAGIVVVLGALHNSTRIAHDLDGQARAQMLAEELLAGWRLEPPKPGRSSGRSPDGEIAWELEVRRWNPEGSGAPAFRFDGGLRLARLTLHWEESRRVRRLQREELVYVGEVR